MSRTTLTHALAALAAFAQAGVALAADKAPLGDVCVLTVTDTNMGPKKPHEIILKLDCGAATTQALTTLGAHINNAATLAEGLQLAVGAGFEIEAYSAWLTVTGNATVHQAILVRDGLRTTGDAADDGDDEAIEEATETTPPATDATDAAADDDEGAEED
ncbi:MAG: hypothetical protein RLZZ383_1497 [Pseudomonadota bacterium]|jgi:hypothetical protein